MAPRFALAGPEDFLGKNFASLYFALNLLESFDGCHFFVPTEADRESARLALEGWGVRDGVEVFSILELPGCLQTHAYSAFFVPDVFPDMATMCHLRRKYAAAFRVVAIIHSISYAAMERDVLDLLLAPTTEADLVLCSSQAGCSALLRLFAHVRGLKGLQGPVDLSLSIIPFGVDTSRFAPGRRDRARAAVGLPDDRHYVLSVARLSIHDKFDCGPLLAAFARATAKVGARWDLVLAGGARDPAYRDFLNAQVRDRGLEGRVQFLPNFADALKPDLYSACDIFVSPSDNLQETFGLAVIEAMACGLPVVASDWDGFKDTVAHGEVGFRIPTYMPLLSRNLSDRRIFDNSLLHLLVAQAVAIDVGQLTEALVVLAHDSELRAQMGKAARARALSLYRDAEIARQVKALLEAPVDPHEVSIEQLLTAEGAGSGSPFQLFRSHATRELTGSDMLVATELGRSALERQVQLYMCAEMQHVMYSDRLQPMVSECLEPCTLESLLATVDFPEADDERLLYSVYWLLKQGLLERCASRSWRPGS